MLERPTLQRSADYVLLLSWHIAEKLIPKLKQKGFRGKFIVPLPAPRVAA